MHGQLMSVEVAPVDEYFVTLGAGIFVVRQLMRGVVFLVHYYGLIIIAIFFFWRCKVLSLFVWMNQLRVIVIDLDAGVC